MIEAKTIYLEAISNKYPKIFSTENSDLYRFLDEEKGYLIKIYKEDSAQILGIFGDTFQKSVQLNEMSKLVKKYYSFTAVSKEYYATKSQICEISPEIVGMAGNNLKYGSEEQLEAVTKIYQWRETWTDLTKNNRFLALPRQTQRHFRMPDISLSNIIVTSNHHYYIIDW